MFIDKSIAFETTTTATTGILSHTKRMEELTATTEKRISGMTTTIEEERKKERTMGFLVTTENKVEMNCEEIYLQNITLLQIIYFLSAFVVFVVSGKMQKNKCK